MSILHLRVTEESPFSYMSSVTRRVATKKLAAWIMRFETEQEALRRRSHAGLSTSLEHRAVRDASVSYIKLLKLSKRDVASLPGHTMTLLGSSSTFFFFFYISSNLCLRLVL